MTAISKVRAVDDLGRLVRQQAALTRVATIVAEGVPAAELFTALTHEVVHALEVPAVSLLRYETDRSTLVLASVNAPDFPVGGRLPLEGRSLPAQVLETGRPARAESELRSEIGVPIVVDGDVWGLIRAAVNGTEPLRADIDSDLRDFTGLLATAISKTESREGLRRVIAEQSALRSVATLVATGAAPAEVFSSVAREVARILDVSAVSVVRFESDTWSSVVASVNDPGFPVGSRWPLDGQSLNATVFATGKPAQIDYSDLPGPVADAARAAGIQVGIGVPIVVEGRVWGMIAVGQRKRRDALPAFAGSYTSRMVLSTASPRETEARLAAFTELVATTISKAQAHDDLRGLAMEQAALRRVATLVARDAPSTEVIGCVATEVGQLLGTDITVVGRYDGDGGATAIGSWSASGDSVPVGTRSALGGHNALTLVAETGQPARVDGYDDASGEAADIARRFGWRSSIAAPIVVEDRLWGVMLVANKEPEPFPAGADERLAAFTDLVATAVSNTEARHALERVAAELAASRRRIVAASDDARRRIERDLHDGAQQSLVSLALAVRHAESNVPPELSDLRTELSAIATGLTEALDGLQELSRGIHPAILSESGLRPALRTLARRSAIPVALDVATDVRLAEPTEVAAYFVASEALANAAKHSNASQIDVSLERRDSNLLLSVRDDGIGGADAARGSGIVGLIDRVEALGGRLTLESPPRRGTSISVELPIAKQAAP